MKHELKIDSVKTSPRIKKLIDGLFATPPQIEAERACLITESYRATEALPIVMRRAKALEHILNNMTIVIRDNEMIVGNLTVNPCSTQIFPEFSYKWIVAEFDRLEKRSGDVFMISKETKAKLKDAFTYWDGKTVNELATENMTPDTIAAMDHNVFTVGNYYFNGVGHISVDYEKVLKVGYKGIIAEAKAELDKLDITSPDSIDKQNFLQALIIACQAAVSYAKRFSKLAAQQAKKATGARKGELENISKICARVPANPAADLYEALQSFWFVQAIMQIESNGHSISPMRFDQYIYPYYKKDIDSGKLTVPQAQELLDCLWVKFNDINKVRDEGSTKAFGGYPMFQNLIVGGQDSNGLDATNELSIACLEATAHTKLPQPSISVRVWNKSPDSLLFKSAEVSRLGLGMPAYYNDEVVIPALTGRGVSLADARDYGMIGCVEPQKGGKTEGWHDSAFFNMAKVLEITLNNGKEGGVQLGPKTGEFTKFKTFDALMNAYQIQMEYFVKRLINAANSVDIAHGLRAPLPFASSMVYDCIGRGKSIQNGGAFYNFIGPQGVGVANVADSLYAIKKLVFEDKSHTLADFKTAIEKNFEGPGAALLKDVEKVPKFGNDVEDVDFFARDVANVYCKEVEKYTTPRGGMYQPGLYPVSANVPMGAATAATPEGRKAGEPLADGVSPVSGKDVSGPTAAANSVARLDHHIASNGTLFNQKFHPSALSGKSGLSNLSALVRGFFDQKGMHVQYNCVSRETLIDAQEHPDEYKTLVVRVAGYSALFTSLDKTLQDDIINRTEHAF